MRLSIDITPEQHQRLKAVSALSGQSMKEYVLNRVLSDKTNEDETEALRQLEAFLKPRIEAAQDEFPEKSVTEIFEEVLQEAH